MDAYSKSSKRNATTTLLLLTFSRQRAPDDLRDYIRECCFNADELLKQNEAYATATEIDILKLDFAKIDQYLNLVECQCELARKRLSNCSWPELDRAMSRASEALRKWAE